MYKISNLDLEVNPLAEEVRLKGSNQDLIILIHGYTGSPREMAELGRALFDKFNYSIIIPRLPGHGTNALDFQTSNKKDWLRKIYDLILNNQNDYQNIHLIGLSMGALISLLASLHFKIKSILLISPALYAKNKKIIFTHLLKYIKPILSNDYEIDEKVENPDLIDLLKNYSCQEYAKQLSELHKLMILTRKNLKKITTKVKIIHSKQDEVVPVKAAKTIYNKISSNDKEIKIFEKSPHVINYGPEKDKLLNEVSKFLKEVCFF